MPTAAHILPSGRVVALQMPDLFGILASVGRVPSQQLIDVLNLLVADGAWTPEEAAADKYLRKRNAVRGYYAIAALCLVEPTLDLSLRADDPRPEGVIGTTDLSWADVEVIYHGWFRGWTVPQAPALPAAGDDAGWPADAAPDGDGVRDDAGAAVRRERPARRARPEPAVPVGGAEPTEGG